VVGYGQGEKMNVEHRTLNTKNRMSRAKPQRRKEMRKSRAGGKRYALKNLKIGVLF
jgi:hypothetical protein